MIPSDHFVRFYNEVFKFLDEENGLEEYYLEISRHQELHCYECFMDKGLEGMEEYWGHIRHEENCISSSYIEDGVRYTHMSVCPSLSKVLDCDAGLCDKYCLHCAGWVHPLFVKCGFYTINYIYGLDIPECRRCVSEDRAKLEAIREQWLAEGYDPRFIGDNFEFADEIEKNKAYRHQRLAEKAGKK